MNPSSIPPRLRESSFRDYESDIAEIVSQFPLVVDLTDRPKKKGKSVATYAARLRDAMLSLATYQWPTTLFDRQRFMQLYKDIKVSQRLDGTLLAGGNVELKEWNRESQIEVQYHAPLDYEKPPVLEVSNDTVDFLFSLAAKKYLRCSLILQPLGVELDPVIVMDNYDVTLIDNKDGSFTLL